MRIGLLEDNPAIRDVFTFALTFEGHTVEAHETGVSLLARLFPVPVAGSGPHPWLPYDVLMVDLGLPGELSGRDVIERISQHLPARPLPILVVSGAGDTVLRELHAEFPSVRILPKPVQLDALLTALEEQALVASGGR